MLMVTQVRFPSHVSILLPISSQSPLHCPVPIRAKKPILPLSHILHLGSNNIDEKHSIVH